MTATGHGLGGSNCARGQDVGTGGFRIRRTLFRKEGVLVLERSNSAGSKDICAGRLPTPPNAGIKYVSARSATTQDHSRPGPVMSERGAATVDYFGTRLLERTFRSLTQRPALDEWSPEKLNHRARWL